MSVSFRKAGVLPAEQFVIDGEVTPAIPGKAERKFHWTGRKIKGSR
jgi:hypothetical protein